MDYERELFKHYIKIELKLSKSTVESYERDIQQFCIYLQKNGVVNWLSCTQALISTYIDHLSDIGTSVSSLQRKASAIRRFFAYLQKYRHYTFTILNKQIQKCNENTSVLLQNHEIKKLLNAPDLKTHRGIRDRAMFELLCATGIKVTELICLDISDIMFENAAIRCRHGTDMRIISFRLSVKKYLQKYMTYSRNALLSGKNEKAFFLNMSGERLTRQGLNKILRGYAAGLNLQDRITPNALRYTFAHKLLESDLSIESIKDLLGHSDVSTTKAFLKSAQKDTIKNNEIKL